MSDQPIDPDDAIGSTPAYVEARYRPDGGVRGRGYVIGYYEDPTYIIECSDGTRFSWRADMTYPAQEPPPAPEPAEPAHAWMVIYERGGLSGIWFGDRAEELARGNAAATNSVVAKLPIVADYRKVQEDV